MYTTARCFVMGMPTPNGEYIFQVTANNLSGGAFRAKIMDDKICIMDHAFKSNTSDEKFEGEIFKEVFRGLVNKKNLPVYFNDKLTSHSTRTLLKEMGATDVVEVNNAWPNEIKFIKIEANSAESAEKSQ